MTTTIKPTVTISAVGPVCSDHEGLCDHFCTADDGRVLCILFDTWLEENQRCQACLDAEAEAKRTEELEAENKAMQAAIDLARYNLRSIPKEKMTREERSAELLLDEQD